MKELEEMSNKEKLELLDKLRKSVETDEKRGFDETIRDQLKTMVNRKRVTYIVDNQKTSEK
jgi:hypothetical protein